MKSILLDTNAYSAYVKGDQKVMDAIVDSQEILVSVFVMGELYYGFKSGSREPENLAGLKRFLKKPTVVTIKANKETAELYGEIKSQLRKQGTPIPVNDIWIAAHCMEKGATLVTYDKDFNNIHNLRIWKP